MKTNNNKKYELLHKDVNRVTRDEEEELGIGMQNVKVLNSDPNSKFLSLFLNQFAISLYVGYRGLFFCLIFVGGI